MLKSVRWALLTGSAALALGGAYAQTSPDLEARLAALEAMVAELKAELAAERAAKAAEIVRLQDAEAKAAAPQSPAPPPNGFRMGNATLTAGGFIDLDTHVTTLSDGSIAANVVGRDFYVPAFTPIGGSGTTVTDFTAESSRFWLSGSQDVGGRKVSALIELDFLLSAQGDQRATNSYAPAVRLAYVDIDNVRVGQDWTTFQNLSAIPESASFVTLVDGMVFLRQPQVRYTVGPWQFAVENPTTTITAVSGARIDSDANTLPDVVARYNLKGDFGNVSFAALGRQLRADQPGLEDETFGWGVSASGQIKFGKRDDLRFNLVGGQGVGRYVGLNTFNGAMVNPLTGELDAIGLFGGMAAWRHPFGETARVSTGFAAMFADNPDFARPTETQSSQSVFAALLWDIAPKVTMGGEVLFGTRELESGASGDLTRVTFSTRYTF